MCILVSQDGNPALHWASESGHIEVAVILLNHGCDILAVNKVYWTHTFGDIVFSLPDSMINSTIPTMCIYSCITRSP